MQQEVPASTRIKDKSIRNVDTDRLCRRRQFLIDNRDFIAREADARILVETFSENMKQALFANIKLAPTMKGF